MTHYQEPHRPQFHFTPPQRWMNDPNGLVYWNGLYHLFYQFHPESNLWGPMHWGHATSRDLVHWDHLPIALYPDDLGTIFSGSIVIDRDNTAGFGANAMVAIYSYNTQSQGIAYSLDEGQTWQKYANNPVLPALSKDFRDPKVFWYAPNHVWIMSLAVGDEIQFFSSPNLLEWTYVNRFKVNLNSGVWECPDLFPLTHQGKTYWVLVISVGDGAIAGGSGTVYFVGDFDGQQFIPLDADARLWLDYGTDNYAAVTWHNAPDGRMLLIGWMSNWRYARVTPTDEWRGAMTIAREISLVDTSDGLRLVQKPVDLKPIRGERLYHTQHALLNGKQKLAVRGRVLEITAEFDIKSSLELGFLLHQGDREALQVTVDTTNQTLQVERPPLAIEHYFGSCSAPLQIVNERVILHILLDESSIEVFANNGTTVVTMQTFGTPTLDEITVFTRGEAEIRELSIYALNTIWGAYQA